MPDIAQLALQVDSKSAATATKTLDGLTAAAGRTEAAAGRTSKAMTATEKSAERMAQSVNRATDFVKRLAGALLTIQAIRQVSQLADAYTNLTSKIRNVTSSEAELSRVRAQIYDISQRTRQSFEATTELYTRMTRATENLGLSEAERLRITETLNKAMIVGGGTTQETTAAIVQITQALSLGKFQMQEFNSVGEQAPVIMTMLMKTLGKTRGELRQMVTDGELTADMFVDVLAKNAAIADAGFANMAVTIDGAMTVLRNAFMNFVGGADSTSAASRTVAEAILSVAEAIDLVSPQVNQLITLWRGQATEQQNVTTTAQDIAYGMKVVVTGLVIAKNAVDVLVAGFRAFVQIGAEAVSTVIEGFSDLATTLPKVYEAMRSPFTIGTAVNEFSALYDRAEQRITDFVGAAAPAANELGAELSQSVMDVADAFTFLNEPMKRAELVTADTAAGVRTLGTAAVKTEEEIAKLAKTEKQMADLMGRLRGAINPITKAWEDYNKAARDAKAIGASLIAQGKNEAQVARLVAEATGLAADNRDREVDAILAKQSAADALLAIMEKEVELAGMSADQRELALAGMEAEEAMLRAIDVAYENGNDSIKDHTKELVKAARATAAERVEAEKLESILSEYDNIGFRGLINKLDLLKDALAAAAAAGEDMSNPERFKKLQAATGDARQEVLLYATDAIGQGISALQSMADEGSKAYKALAVAQAANNVVAAIGAVVNQGNGDPYTAFARMAAMAAAVSQLVGSIGAFSAGPGAESAASRQATQGRGSVLGDAEAQSESMARGIDITADATSEMVGIERGMLRALLSMEEAIAGASNILARSGNGEVSLGTGAVNPLPGGGSFSLLSQAFANIFGGKESLRDQGILIVGGALSDMIDDIMVQSYATIHRSGGWFSSSRNYDRTADLGDDVAMQFQLVLDSMADAVREGARVLGLNMDEVNAAIDAYHIEEIRISTMDLSAEEAQAELEAVFSRIFDGLAGAVVPFIAQFQEVGEGLGETLIRVATSVQVAQEAVLQLGLAIVEMDPEHLAQVSVGLVNAAGGIEAFIEGLQSFVANFAPESHRFAVAQDELNRAFAQAGLTVPETRDGMWALMQSLDRTTESGQEQIATLLRLSGVADAYYNALDQRAETAADAARDAADAAAEAAAQDLAARSLLIGIGRDRDYANMSAAARAIADVNSRFSDLRIQLNATNPTLAEAGELERARTQALEDANAALRAQGRELVEGLEFEESLVGLTEVQVEIININREFDGYVDTLLDLGFALDSAEIATLEAIRAARILRAEQEAVAESTQVMTISISELRESIGIFIEDLRKQFEHLMDPGFRNWIEGLAGITLSADSSLITRASVIEEVSQSYANGIESLTSQIAAAQMELDALGSATGGAERNALVSKLRNLEMMLGDVTGALGDAMDYANRLFEQQLGDLLSSLRDEFGTDDPLAKINQRFDRLIEQAIAWGASMTQLAEIEEFRIIALQRAGGDLYQSQLDMIRHLQGFLNGMLLGPNSPLSATERTDEAWAQLQQAVTAGNAEEATRLADVYLQLLRESQASGDDFNSQFYAVRDLLTAMRDAAVQAITDNATEQYLADLVAGGALQLHALERLTAVMDAIRVAMGGAAPTPETVGAGFAAGSYTAAYAPESPASLAAEFALMREELAAIKEAVKAGSEKVAVTVDKAGERSDRTNDVSRSRHSRPTERSVR